MFGIATVVMHLTPCRLNRQYWSLQFWG